MKYYLFIILILSLNCKKLVGQTSCSIQGKKFVFSVLEKNLADSSGLCKEILDYYDSVTIGFAKKLVIIQNGRYSAKGKYTVDMVGDICYIKIKFKRKQFSFYENGSLERSKFAIVLHDLKQKDNVINQKEIYVRSKRLNNESCLLHFVSAE